MRELDFPFSGTDPDVEGELHKREHAKRGKKRAKEDNVVKLRIPMSQELLTQVEEKCQKYHVTKSQVVTLLMRTYVQRRGGIQNHGR